jgi:hypothetical protein
MPIHQGKRGKEMSEKSFNPLVFLASLGAGGIAVMPFVLFQYTVEHGAGLINRAMLWENGITGISALYILSLESIMVIFTTLHIFLTVYFGIKLVKWLRTKDFNDTLNNPLKNANILVPVISLLMTLNVFIGPVRYFIPFMQSNFQSLFLPALLFWAGIFVVLMGLETHLLSISFRKGFDIEKISFGWLLHPFALGMLAVVGTGIAAMAQDIQIANTAAFLSFIPISMGLFFLAIKMVVLFKKHFSGSGLPEKQFMPSFLIVIPNITLYAISLFRLGHYIEHVYAVDLHAYFFLIIGLFFSFEIWYLIFGINLLKDYFKKHHLKDFYMTQWGFICPFVAFVVLGSFAYNVVFTNVVLYSILIVTLYGTVLFYIELLIKHLKCSRLMDHNVNCEA